MSQGPDPFPPPSSDPLPPPPPASVPPPPPIADTYAPPPARTGKPWWVWVLGGCGGCLVIMLIAMVALGVAGKKFWDSVSVGPVTVASVEKSLGSVPLYPNGKLNQRGTEMALQALRLTEKVAQKPPGTLFKGMALIETADAPDKVLSFYKERLTGEGWKLLKDEDRGQQVQQSYQKGNEMAMISTQPQGSGGTVITVMVGGPEMAQHAPKPGSTPGAGQ